MERDGLANSLHHFEQVREDARAIESELLGEAVQQPVHLGRQEGAEDERETRRKQRYRGALQRGLPGTDSAIAHRAWDVAYAQSLSERDSHRMIIVAALEALDATQKALEQAIMEAPPDAFWVRDEHGRTLYHALRWSDS